MGMGEILITIIGILVSGLVLLILIVAKYESNKLKIENDYLKNELRKKENRNEGK